MKPDLRISIKDYHRNKSLKVMLNRNRQEIRHCIVADVVGAVVESLE